MTSMVRTVSAHGIQEEIRSVFAIAGGVLIMLFLVAYLLQRKSLACDLDKLAAWNHFRAEQVNSGMAGNSVYKPAGNRVYKRLQARGKYIRRDPAPMPTREYEPAGSSGV